MMWIAFAIAAVVALAALAWVAWPLLRRGPAPIMVEDDRLTELLGRKDATLKAIKDLEFDYQVGKLSAADYQVYDQRLRSQAMSLMRQIEQLAPQSAALDASIEAEIAQRRRVHEPAARTIGQAAVTADAGGPLVAAPAAAENRRPPEKGASGENGAAAAPSVAAGGGSARYCTNCGYRLEPNHKFCANCGTPVANEPVAN